MGVGWSFCLDENILQLANSDDDSYCGYINITDIHIRNGYNDGFIQKALLHFAVVSGTHHGHSTNVTVLKGTCARSQDTQQLSTELSEKQLLSFQQ